LKLLHGHADEVAAWVGWRIPLIRKRLERDPNCKPFGPCYAIGVLDQNNTLIAGVVYHAWAPDFQSVELSFAADTPRWLTRNLICELLAYPFETLGCNRINAYTPKKNREARGFIDKFGFRREGCATDGFGPCEDAIISRLLKREWLQTKWAKPFGSAHP
jgi:RimJ/RimL family protein N-acetyltransferase